MLSKMARIEEKEDISPSLTKDVVSPSLLPKDFEKMKINDLKQILRNLGLRISGNKPELIERIRTHKAQSSNSIKIQRTVRGHLARLWVRLKKGEGGPCVNDSDFYTLEPISEIPFYYYIHYTEDKSNTNYAFNILSLCSMISKSGKFENPYTRENMKHTCLNKLTRIIKLTKILFPHTELMVDLKDICVADKIQSMPRPIFNFDRRIIELFIAIDTLGNYTQREWFLNLTNAQLCNLILRINTLWLTATPEVRTSISPNVAPFSIQNTGVTRMSLELSLEENRIIALKIAEALVYNGVDNEHKIMGAMFFLTGLTLVSYPARLQMPWLYDNYNYYVVR
jgi:hypothetical protein